MFRIYQGLVHFLFWKTLLVLKRKNYWFQIVIFFFLSLLTTLVTAPFIWLIDQLAQDGDFRPDTTSFITVLVLAPILETYLFQHLPFKMMQSFSKTRGKYGLYIVFTSIIFGCLHTYSASYVLFAFTLGLVLSYIYYFYSNHLNLAFWSTALIHFLRNLLATLFDYYDI